MRGTEFELSTAENYRRWGSAVAAKSPLYAALCEGIAGDPEMLAFLDARPPQKRQPNLLLAAVRLLYGLRPDYAAFRTTVLAHHDAVAAVLESRRTQTNEPGRCAPMLPLLAALPQPPALLEVGAAAGLCLLPDRYAYDYAGHRVGAAAVVFPCPPEGPVPLPSAALAIARGDPPRVVRGDLIERLPALAAEAPRAATLVVFHTAVLAYLTTAQREELARRVRELGATWIACEAPGVLPALGAAERGFVLGVDGRRVATCDSHGRWIRWG